MTGQIAPPSTAWHPLVELLLASVVIMGSPGPSTMSATAMGAAFGIRRSLSYTGGLIAGTIGVLLAVATGVVALVLSMPRAGSVLGLAAAAYILYLAFRIATASPLASQSRQLVAPAFGGGFLLAIANPKAYLAIAAVFAGTTVIREDTGVDALMKTASLGAMIVIIHICWLSVGASLSRVLRDSMLSRVVNVALALVLVAMTLASLVLEPFPGVVTVIDEIVGIQEHAIRERVVVQVLPDVFLGLSREAIKARGTLPAGARW
jgi:threonine/homoserine/homoserine lactone efflux protein